MAAPAAASAIGGSSDRCADEDRARGHERAVSKRSLRDIERSNVPTHALSRVCLFVCAAPRPSPPAMSSYADSTAEQDLRPRNWLESLAARMMGSAEERRSRMLDGARESAALASSNKHRMVTQRQLGMGGEGNGFFLTRTTLNRDSYIEKLYAANRDKILEANRLHKAAAENPAGPEAAELKQRVQERREKEEQRKATGGMRRWTAAQ